jgi:hypothetical protein
MPKYGRPNAQAIPFAAVEPINNDEAKPGPLVAAKTSISRIPSPATPTAFSTNGLNTNPWFRDANSGTTPPCSRCKSICDATSEANTTARPPDTCATTATAVSSQDDSIANTTDTRRPYRPRKLLHHEKTQADGNPDLPTPKPNPQ